MAKKQKPDVIEGQIWLDRDPRMFHGNRRVRVYRVIGSPGAVVHDVLYRQVVRGSDDSSRIYKSRYARFQQAFELVQSDAAVARSGDDQHGPSTRA